MGNKLRELFKPETKWLDKRITDNDPCDACEVHKEHYERLVYDSSATREEAAMETPEQCKHCTKKSIWISECLCKLRWYENNDLRLKEPDKELYEGNDVLVKKPWELDIIEGYSGAFCECGHVLHIKTPRRKAFHAIKCPICEHIVSLYCGEEGEQLSMDDIRRIVPIVGVLGD